MLPSCARRPMCLTGSDRRDHRRDFDLDATLARHEEEQRRWRWIVRWSSRMLADLRREAHSCRQRSSEEAQWDGRMAKARSGDARAKALGEEKRQEVGSGSHLRLRQAMIC